MLDFPVEVREFLSSGRPDSRLVAVATYGERSVEFDVDSSGSVVFDGSAQVQSDASVLAYGLGPVSLVPKSKTDFLAPYGQEVSLFREVRVREDATYRVPLGVFRVTGNSDHFEDVRPVGEPVVIDPANSLVEAGDGLYYAPSEWVEDPDGSELFVLPESWDESLSGGGPVAPGLYPVAGLTSAGVGLYSVAGLSSAGVGLYSPPGGSADGLVEFLTAAEQLNRNRSVVMSWSVGVDLADRFRVLERAKFLEEKSPLPGGTVYSELQRLCPIPVAVNPAIADKTVPADMEYGDRLSTVYDLADLVGAVPHMTREGVLTLRVKDAWLSATPVFDIEGTIDWTDGQQDEFYNYVRASSPDGEFTGYWVLDDDSHPLSVNRAGLSTYEHTSPLYTSNQACAAGARTLGLRLLSRRSRIVKVKAAPEALLLELGDVGWVRDPVQGRNVRGEVVRIEVPNDVSEPIGLDLIVPED